MKKEIDTSTLPKKYGIGANEKKLVIDWDRIENNTVRFIYGDLCGVINLINYNKNTKMLTIIYNDKEYHIQNSVFINCGLGRILGKITPDFKIEIGQTFKDNKRDITITDRKKILAKNGQWIKYYKYHCNICGFSGGEHYSCKDEKYKEELWIMESNLLKGIGCSCCCSSPQIVVENINSIVATDPWMIRYFDDYNEAKKYTKCSGNKIRPICPDCGRVSKKKITIDKIYQYHSISCSCGDNISYGEKMVFSVLEQLKMSFITQLNKTTFNWCGDYRYDFYFKLNDEGYIIEAHGLQHYEGGFERMGKKGRTAEEEQLNDKIKKELALANGIKEENYIIIDCRYSTLKHIKNSILNNNKINNRFDLSEIDWDKCHEFAINNLAKIACNYKKNNPNLTTVEVGNMMGYASSTILGWFKQGNELGWCVYDAKIVQFENGKATGKMVEIFKDNISLGIFDSVSELERKSKKLFGIELKNSSISRVCRGEREEYKGYNFKYIKELKLAI